MLGRRLLEALLRRDTTSVGDDLYFALGAYGDEVSGQGYARQTVERGTDYWTKKRGTGDNFSGVMFSGPELVFGPAGYGDWDGRPDSLAMLEQSSSPFETPLSSVAITNVGTMLQHETCRMAPIIVSLPLAEYDGFGITSVAILNAMKMYLRDEDDPYAASFYVGLSLVSLNHTLGIDDIEEPEAADYARIAVARSAAGWPDNGSAGGMIGDILSWGPAQSGWGTVRSAFLASQQESGGDLIAWWNFGSAKTVVLGDIVRCRLPLAIEDY